MIRTRIGMYDLWLEPQVHAAALCWQMLEKVQDELMNGKLSTQRQGSKEQYYTEVNPLMPTYKELQRTMIQHYEALGLNYKTTPSKIKEDVEKGVNAKKDPLREMIQGAQKAAMPEIE